jgi:hypothetical protein
MRNPLSLKETEILVSNDFPCFIRAWKIELILFNEN